MKKLKAIKLTAPVDHNKEQLAAGTVLRVSGPDTDELLPGYISAKAAERLIKLEVAIEPVFDMLPDVDANDETHPSNWTKEQIQSELTALAIPYKSADNKATLLALLAENDDSDSI